MLIFSAIDACAMIAEASGGVPRVINVLCDMALVYGFSTGSSTITSDLVREVIKDKQSYGIFPMNRHRPGEVVAN